MSEATINDQVKQLKLYGENEDLLLKRLIKMRRALELSRKVITESGANMPAVIKEIDNALAPGCD